MADTHNEKYYHADLEASCTACSVTILVLLV